MRLSTGWILVACGVGWSYAEAAEYTSGASIAGGLFHTCMIRQDLSLVCFGGGGSDLVPTLSASGSVEDAFGTFGQIGSGNNDTLGDEDGEMGYSLSAVDLGDEGAQAVAAGQSHTCVLLESGEVACWGYNDDGQLGTEDQVHRGTKPEDMGTGLDFVSLGSNRTATDIGCGQHHCCAVLDDGSLKCWGWNSNGMLGLGDTDARGDAPGTMGDDLEAVELGTGRTAVYVDGGRYHTCALLDNKSVKCWGGGNETDHNHGQLGQGDTRDIGSYPEQMGDALPEIDFGSGRTVEALAVGWFHTCVILDDQTVRCFGRNHDGQLGLGDTEDRGDEEGEMGDSLEVVDLGTDKLAVAITCGRWHTCVLLSDETIKCFGVNSSDDLGAGQLGLEDDDERGQTADTTGDSLETVDLGTGRVPVWVRAAFDHTCVIFEDSAVKCWGLNASGQLGLGDTDDRGDEEGSMGNSLPSVEAGGRVSWPESVLTYSESSDETVDEESSQGASLDEVTTILVSVAGAFGAVILCGLSIILVRCYQWHRQEKAQRKEGRCGDPEGLVVIDPCRSSMAMAPETIDETMANSAPRATSWAEDAVTPESNTRQGSDHARGSKGSFEISAGLAAAGTAGVVVAGGMAAGWNVLGLIADNLPWVGVAYYLLNDILDMVDTKHDMEGNMEKIRRWASSLQGVLLQMGKQMKEKPSVGSKALQAMSEEVVSSLQELVDTVASYNQKGTLAQYVASRSCQQAVDAADTALRGALMKLSVGQGAELMSMVSRLEDAGLVVDEKLDMIIEHMKRQEAHAARLELRLAEYSEHIAETLGQFIAGGGIKSIKSKVPAAKAGSAQSKKTLRELGRERLDKLQISKESITFPTKVPFAAGAHSQVYQVLHEGVVKAAKVVNLTRLGLSMSDVDKVFGRFVKELYILSQMKSQRVVSVYGAIASTSELTLIMEYAERGSLRTVIRDEDQRRHMRTAPGVLHQLLVDTAEGMAYVYDIGVEHRDLKSDNCLVTHDWRVKITDFGLSKTTDAISSASTTSVSPFRGGTLAYSAPELLPGGMVTDQGGYVEELSAELCDVFSYGVVMWDVVVSNGELPWAEIPSESIPFALRSGKRLRISPQCELIYRETMTDCWRQDPRERPSFKRLLEVLQLAGGARPMALSPPAFSPERRTKNSASRSTFEERQSWRHSRQRSLSESPKRFGRDAGSPTEPTARPTILPSGAPPLRPELDRSGPWWRSLDGPVRSAEEGRLPAKAGVGTEIETVLDRAQRSDSELDGSAADACFDETPVGSGSVGAASGAASTGAVAAGERPAIPIDLPVGMTGTARGVPDPGKPAGQGSSAAYGSSCSAHVPGPFTGGFEGDRGAGQSTLTRPLPKAPPPSYWDAIRQKGGVAAAGLGLPRPSEGGSRARIGEGSKQREAAGKQLAEAKACREGVGAPRAGQELGRGDGVARAVIIEAPSPAYEEAAVKKQGPGDDRHLGSRPVRQRRV